MQIRTDSFADAYDVFEELGSGQFAIVKRCREKKSKQDFAAKFVIKRRPNSASRKGLFREKILQEIEILGELHHPHIISLHDVFETSTELILVLELVAGGELFDYISEKDHLTEEEAARFITQILEGVEHFHARSIVHLDLKPENVMLLDRKTCSIKIIDFGISRKLKPGEKVMETYGTPEFVAPEIIQYQPISCATDMWSIGVITYILLSGASPFLGDSKQETFANITNIDYSFDDEFFGHTSDLAKDFITKLFVKDVRKRASIKECLEHPWIKPRRRQDEEQRRQAQINIEQFKSFIARRRWKQAVKAVCLGNRIIRKSQFRLALCLENINCVSFGKNLLNNGDDFMLTALLCAAEDGDVNNLSELLQIATNIDINKTNKNKETALHLAACAGQVNMVKLLHMHKINVHSQDINGETALHFACRCNSGSNGVDAAKRVITYLVQHAGLSLDVQNKNGETALHIASRYGCAEIVRFLCELGANLDIQDDLQETALHVCAWHGSPDIVKILCHYGCDVNLKNKEGETGLITACARGCVESIKLLIEHKADLNARDKKGNTALHWAIKRHYTIIALLLIQADCNMDMLDANGESALHIACRENLLPVVQTMCALGCRVDIKNKKEMTPLHTAIEKNEIDAVRCLCLAGLDLNITNKDGLSAEQLATSLKYNNIASLLSSLRREENREIFIEQLVPNGDPLRKIKVKFLGSSGVGKSTLIGSLKCSYINSFFRKTLIGNLSNATPSTKSSTKNVYKTQKNNFRVPIVDIITLSTHNETKVPSIETSSQRHPQQQQQLQRHCLDNYELVDYDHYTRGIDITPFVSGTQHFSLWDFSGYEPYHCAYDRFIGDVNCVHVIVYDASLEHDKCLAQVICWLEFLRARIPPSAMTLASSTSHSSATSFSSFSSTTPSSSSTSSAASSQSSTSSNVNNNSPIPPFDQTSHVPFPASGQQQQQQQQQHHKAHVILVGTHADKVSGGNKTHVVDKARKIMTTVRHMYSQDNVLDLQQDDEVVLLDARAAWVIETKQFVSRLVRLKERICERLPRGTMFLNRALAFVQELRRQNKRLPVVHWRQFVQQVHERVNPLASDEHLRELVHQMQIMGEVVFVDSHNSDQDGLVCYEPAWLCGAQCLGRLLSHERFVLATSGAVTTSTPAALEPAKVIKTAHSVSGLLTHDDIKKLFDIDINDQILVELFAALELCAEYDDDEDKRRVYEFPTLNLLSETTPTFQTLRKHRQPTDVVFNGFRIKCSQYHLTMTDDNNNKLSNMLVNNKTLANDFHLPSSLAAIFARIQVNLRLLANSSRISSSLFIDAKQQQQQQQHVIMLSPQQQQLKLDTQSSTTIHIMSTPSSSSASSSSSVSPATTTATFNPNNRAISMQSLASGYPRTNGLVVTVNNNKQPKKLLLQQQHQSFNSLADIELSQSRYCSRLIRPTYNIECLLSLEPTQGHYIELRACAPDTKREELFYFVQDLYAFVEQVIADACPSINLERHFIDFAHNICYTPRELMQQQGCNNKSLLLEIVCCGSEQIEQNIMYGIDLSLCDVEQSDTCASYMRRMLCARLDCQDPLGRDWCMLAVLLGLQDLLPVLLEQQQHQHKSNCAYVLDEWCQRKPEQATVRNLLSKLSALGRVDVSDMILNTTRLFLLSNKHQLLLLDSGIQNSSQTLASIK